MAEAHAHNDYLRPDILLDVATPQLYRTNAFRVLGLSVCVDGAEMSRQQKKLRMLEKLGGVAAQNHSGALPLTPPPSSDELRKAGQRLHDMQARIVDELFWFWPASPGPANDGDKYSLLKTADLAAAQRAWSSVPPDHPDWAVANHNLAVMHHALALDVECDPDGQLSEEPDLVARLDHNWSTALSLWAKVSGNEALWTHVVSRAEALDDPRLTSGFVRRMRHSLPLVLVSISINLAVRAAKRGDADRARRHLMYIRESGLDLHLADSVLEREASPLVEQVQRICRPVADRSTASPGKADQLAKSVLQDCRVLLTGIRAIFGKGHHLRQTAFDLVASTVRDCIIDYGNATKDWGRCIQMLEHAASLALTEGPRSRLRDDLAQVKKYHAEEQHVEELKRAVTTDRVYEVTIHDGQVRMATICTCCLGPATEKQPVSYQWEDTQGITRYKRSISFQFPICDSCQQHQTEYSRRRAILVLLAAGISTGIIFVVASAIRKPEWLPFATGGGVITLTLAFILSTMIRLRELPEQHACRDQAVEMPEASDSHVVFRFYSPLYAEAFAQSNGVAVSERQMRKPTRGSYILAGRGAVLSLLVAIVLGGIGQSIIYAVKKDNWQRGTPSPSRSHQTTPSRTSAPPRASTRSRTSAPPRASTPSRTFAPPRASTPPHTYSGLSNRIDSGKARATVLEVEIGQMDSQLESISASITRYKREIKGYETQVWSEFRLNQYAYEQALEQHNRLVARYNSLLVSRNAKYGDYQREIDSVNDMVSRYNRGER